MLNKGSLSLEQAPPISVPFRLFLTAPVFSFLAGLLLLYYGPEALATRWSPVTLALTHLITLGFLASVMFGAVIQILPVLASSPVPQALWLSRLLHFFLTLGVIFLVISFLVSFVPWMRLAVFSLGAGFALFIIAVAAALYRVKISNDTVVGIRFALIAFVITIGLGLLLGINFAWPLGLVELHLLTDTHLGWGVMGWIGLLVIGVAYQVVPMFQMTPEYPAWMVKYLTTVLFIGCLIWSGLTFGEARAGIPTYLNELWLVIVIWGYIAFAVITLRIQMQRIRRLPDVTLLFWRIGMGAVLVAVLIWLAGLLIPALKESQWHALLLGGCLFFGFAYSVVNGMLYKIVPFLSWFHLQHRKVSLLGGGGIKVPNMKDFLPDRLAKRQYYFHLGVLLLLVLAVIEPVIFSRPLGGVLMLSSILLGYNLTQAAYRYRQVDREISQQVAASQEIMTMDIEEMRNSK